MSQLTFDLGARAAFGREDFFISPANALALATLDAPEGWPAGKMLLIGPAGAGKSHLAAIWAQEREAEVVLGARLTEGALPALLGAKAVVVEDADQLACEDTLFHLHNALAGGHLLLTARTPPRDWGLRLPDLRSRMEAMATVRLQAPDDALLMAVLVKLFADRQLHVPVGVIGYLVARMDRSLEAVRAVVAALDGRALAQGRAITRQMAAEVLDTAL